MNFALTEEQELLRSAARDFLARSCPPSYVRERLTDGRGYDPALYAQMAELGWAGLAIPESLGGAGLGVLELALLCEEVGRALAPCPLLGTLLGSLALLRGGSDAQQAHWLPATARGERRLCVALPDGGALLRAEPAAGGARLSGLARFVPDAHDADLCIVAAQPAGAPAGALELFLVERGAAGFSGAPLESLDATRELAELHFAASPAARLGGARPHAEVAAWVRDRGLVALAAEAVGGCEKVLEDTVAHAKRRVQFGKPIGAQQAVQHQCAALLEELESARAIARYAAWAADSDESEAPLAAAMAKARAGDAYRRMTADSIQLHGGIGFTFELDCHLYYRRARASDALLGDAAAQRARIAELL